MMRVATVLVFLILATVRLEAEGGSTLRAGDAFELHVGGIPQEYANDFAVKYKLGLDGIINVPMVGGLKAVGLTPKQLEHAIEEKLVAGKISAHPTVTVTIDTTPANRIVAVSGGVQSPQLLPWRPDLTLSSGISGCGGLTDFSSGRGIRIVRAGKIIGPFNLRDVQVHPVKDPKLVPGDQVIVPE